MSGFSGSTVAGLSDVAWATWTPTFTMSTVGGTPITAAVSGTGARFKQIGKTVYFTLDATISNIGVGNAGAFLFTLPVTAFNASVVVVGTGKEPVVTGKLLSMSSNSATQGSIVFYDNTGLITGGNGVRPQCGGFYEAA